jgi:diphthine-ammonia ligase
MRLAALYSGGKDSTFSMYLAKQMGYEIPYIVNIMPKDRASWIFHTPNLVAVPMMAESMGVELITAESSGTEEGDLESLKSALRDLDIDGVVTGAVWSDYQWDRMNRVCGELNLKTFSPLWRKNQDIVMDAFLDSGIKAIIVGCYAEGLDESWLGRPINKDTVSELRKLRDKFGISIMGEGGEYESMTLDSPMNAYPLEILKSEKEWNRNEGTLHVKEVGPVH